jgi:hypothetical protein
MDLVEAVSGDRERRRGVPLATLVIEENHHEQHPTEQ